MPYPATPVFMVERCNPRTVRKGSPPVHREPRDGCKACAKGWDDSIEDWRRVDTGEVIARDVDWHAGNLPPGAMWFQGMRQSNPPTGPDDWTGYTEENLASVRASFAEHPEYYRAGASPGDPTLPARGASYLFVEGPQLTVVCPNGAEWTIDSRASNCTLPYDYEHRCWVRHGDPPNVTVDKNGLTCAAGGGSIQAGDYHGFLQNGVLTAG